MRTRERLPVPSFHSRSHFPVASAGRSALKPKSAALKNPQDRREVERQLEELARRGNVISEAKRELDEILAERGESW